MGQKTIYNSFFLETCIIISRINHSLDKGKRKQSSYNQWQKWQSQEGIQMMASKYMIVYSRTQQA